MKTKHREDLNWIQGALIGVAASMGEDDKEKKDVLRCAQRMITTMLEDESTDLHPGDSRLEALNFQMSLGGDELYLFRDEDGALLVIKSVYRKPFDSWKEVECYKRLDKDGRPYVAVMSGCILRGTIYPYKIGEQLVETLGAVYNAAGVAAEGEQMSI